MKKFLYLLVVLGGILLLFNLPSFTSLSNESKLFSNAISATPYDLQRFVVDNNGEVYAAKGNLLYQVDGLTDEIKPVYDIGYSIVGIHVMANGHIIVSTDNNHRDAQVANRIFESKDAGKSFNLIKINHAGSALWWSLASDKLGNLYVGEYGDKRKGFSKRVWKRDAVSDKWSVIFTAPDHDKVHIHRVAIDPVTQYLWVTVGDDKKYRGVHLSKDAGLNWNYIFKAQATGIAFTENNIYWGRDKRGEGGVFLTDSNGDNKALVFDCSAYRNCYGSIYQMISLPDGSVLAPLMKYANDDNVASLWHGKNKDWALLMTFHNKQGQGVDVSSIAGPDKYGYVYVTGYKLDTAQLQPVKAH